MGAVKRRRLTGGRRLRGVTRGRRRRRSYGGGCLGWAVVASAGQWLGAAG